MGLGGTGGEAGIEIISVEPSTRTIHVRNLGPEAVPGGGPDAWTVVFEVQGDGSVTCSPDSVTPSGDLAPGEEAALNLSSCWPESGSRAMIKVYAPGGNQAGTILEGRLASPWSGGGGGGGGGGSPEIEITSVDRWGAVVSFANVGDGPIPPDYMDPGEWSVTLEGDLGSGDCPVSSLSPSGEEVPPGGSAAASSDPSCWNKVLGDSAKYSVTLRGPGGLEATYTGSSPVSRIEIEEVDEKEAAVHFVNLGPDPISGDEMEPERWTIVLTWKEGNGSCPVLTMKPQGEPLNEGEVGLAASDPKCWQKIVDGAKEYAVTLIGPRGMSASKLVRR